MAFSGCTLKCLRCIYINCKFTLPKLNFMMTYISSERLSKRGEAQGKLYPEETITDENFSRYRKSLIEGKYNLLTIKIKDVKILEKLNSITALTLEGRMDLKEIISFFPKLNTLQLSNSSSSCNIDPIINFNHLDDLRVVNSSFTSTTAILNVRKLSIIGSFISDNQFQNFPGVEFLTLGTTRNAHSGGLDNLKNLRGIDLLWEKDGTVHLDDLSSLPNLQAIYTFRASKLSHLPDLKNCKNFLAISLNESHKILDITGLYDTPNLDVVSIVHCRGLRAESLYPFKGHPTLRKLYFGSMIREQEKVMNYFPEIWDSNLLNTEYILPDIN